MQRPNYTFMCFCFSFFFALRERRTWAIDEANWQGKQPEAFSFVVPGAFEGRKQQRQRFSSACWIKAIFFHPCPKPEWAIAESRSFFSDEGPNWPTWVTKVNYSPFVSNILTAPSTQIWTEKVEVGALFPEKFGKVGKFMIIVSRGAIAVRWSIKV